MNKILTGGLAALTLGGAVLGAASQASAHEWRHHDGDAGAAVAAGIFGLAVGAALASSGDHDYGPRYYRSDDYGPAYYDSDDYAYRRHCWTENRWNYRWGGYERVQICR